MKKLFALSLLFVLALGVNAQNLVNFTAVKQYDAKGNTLSSTTTTIYASAGNISSVVNSGAGSLVYFRNPLNGTNGVVASFSTASSPATIASLVSSTAVAVPVQTAYTTSATVTAAELAGGCLAVTGTVAVTLTLPTASVIASQIGAGAGSVFDFNVLNNSTGGTATIAVGSGITASDFPGTNTLTRTASATVGIARFRLLFLSGSAAILIRIS